MTMKKIATCLFAATMIFSATACGTNNDQNRGTTQQQSTRDNNGGILDQLNDNNRDNRYPNLNNGDNTATRNGINGTTGGINGTTGGTTGTNGIGGMNGGTGMNGSGAGGTAGTPGMNGTAGGTVPGNGR
jgi:hypothetical protein